MKLKITLLIGIFSFACSFAQNSADAAKFLDSFFGKNYTQAQKFFADEVKGQISEQLLAMAQTQISAGKGTYQKSTFVS